MKQTVNYMAVQIVKRDATGTLVEWYEGELRGSMAVATDDALSNAAMFPGTPYVVIERTIKEVSVEYCARIEISPRRGRPRKGDVMLKEHANG